DKVALFCNVKKDCVIENTTVPDLYEAPLMLEDQGLSEIVCRELKLDPRKMNLEKWTSLVDRIHGAKKEVTIALVGKYVALHDAYLSVVEALKHAGYETDARVHIKWVEAEEVNEESAPEIFKEVQGIIVPGGFGNRGIEGMVSAAKYARENNVPYFGLCLGMQIATIEFARSVLGYKDANSNEFDYLSEHKVIDFIHGQSDDIDKGGTMRLGAYPCEVQAGSLLEKCYGSLCISERHRHRYEFNIDYKQEFEANGMKIGGISPDHTLVEAIEYTQNDFYVGVQYHPEFKSRPNKAHPLFKGFVEASLKGVE
ncbi:MAG: CTP synthase, partial [Erysipelotrichaceae bacterium]|nr:CTP synthase [Erysipelotrichaceae bacterium]